MTGFHPKPSQLVLGGTAPRHASRTAAKLAGFAVAQFRLNHTEAQCHRYLDVGCGNGFLTEYVADALPFQEVVGIDVEPQRLADFRLHRQGDLRVPNSKHVVKSAWLWRRAFRFRHGF